MRRKKIGVMDFHGSVDITDPSYDRDTWCRMNDVKIKKGDYTCVVWYHTDKGNYDGKPYCYKQVGIIGIYLNGVIPVQKAMKEIGSIGVDAGLAGFFHDKPDYEQLLDNPEEEVRGTVKELAEKYGQDVMTMVGFLDGINDSLKVPNPIETMDENTDVTLVFDKEMLYKNMVDARADWLYELPQWDKIFDADTKKKLYREQKQSGTVRKAKKIGRNEPCPCGSGKKYKYCCGKNA